MADEMFDDVNTIPRATYRRFNVSLTKSSRINPIMSIIPMKIELLMFYPHAQFPLPSFITYKACTTCHHGIAM